MLIEFSVSNFRSFRETQTLSLVAAPRLQKKQNTFKPQVDGESLPSLLKVIAVYGPNASGKSNLIRALDTIGILMRANAGDERVLPVLPFRFDSALADEPSNFEVHFIADRMRYQFNLAVTPTRVFEEKLIAFPKGRESLLYHRQFRNDRDEYTFGNDLQGGGDLHQAWRLLTSPKTLFLTQAVKNSNEELQQLRPAYHWLHHGIMGVDELKGWAGAIQNLVTQNPRFVTDISRFLQEMDVPVTSFRVEDADQNQLASILTKKKSDSSNSFTTTFTHRTLLGEAEFTFEEESEGTKGLFGFWLPWSVLSMKPSPETFKILAIDEFDSSLHPEIVASLVKRHLSYEYPAQLIFTTHDTHLMDTKLLRRDQFWLTERNKNGATVLRSIYDFAGREGEDIEKRYYEGRYRSLPIVSKD